MKTFGRAGQTVLYRIEGELSVQPFWPVPDHPAQKNVIFESPDIQTATFRLIHRLFGQYGLIVLIADLAAFKKGNDPGI